MPDSVPSPQTLSQVEIREVLSIDEYDSCIRLQREVFGLPDLEISPRRHLIVSREAGGWTLAAFNQGSIVGFVHHLAAVRGDEIFGYSHMMAVAAAYQNLGVGAKLKWAQRTRALAEGRKFGVAVGLISQRPGKLDPDVLSQCNTQFLMRIINPVDQGRVAESVESIGRDLINELPALNKGQAIIAGAAVNTPVLCNIRPRHTPHGANDLHAPSEWLRFFEADKSAERDRENALPRQPSRSDSLLRGSRRPLP